MLTWKSIASPKRLTVIAGPCVIEDRQLCLRVARKLVPLCKELGINYVFKASYDKANRTSGKSFRGPGLDEGLAVLAEIREKFDVPVLTDIHSEEQARRAAEFVDILQIPAFLCRQTDLLQAAVETDRIVNVKKGQFLSPQEMVQVVKKAQSFGAKKLMLTERGTSFGYGRLVVDMTGFRAMADTGHLVVFDATHSVQEPGSRGTATGGCSSDSPARPNRAAAPKTGADRTDRFRGSPVCPDHPGAARWQHVN